MKAKIRRFIVYILSETIGSLFILLDPKKADELAKAGMTVQMQHLNLTFKERLMRKAILRKTKRKGEFDLLAEFHQNYWKKKGAAFFFRNTKVGWSIIIFQTVNLYSKS